MNYVWKEPPANARRGRGRLIGADLLSTLKSNPGKWLSVGIQTRSSWARSVDAYHKGEIQMVSSKNNDGKAEIFLRWIA
jgi:hypothetical protein